MGLLKNKFINFTPELPEHYQKSIQNLGVGLMNKILVSFTENFWGNSAWLSIGCEERGKFSHFYNFSQNGKHILCCFITDDFARKAENLSDEVIMEDFLSLLKKIYKTKKV